MADSSQPLLDLLMREMRANKDFVGIHAAEILSEHGFGSEVDDEFRPQSGTTAPMYRIGVWRVMVRIASGEKEREDFENRIRAVMRDPAAPDRVHAVETLGKLEVGNRGDRPVLEEWLKQADDATAAFALWALLHSSTPEERPADEARLARLLGSTDPVARHRSAYALGRLAKPSAESVARLLEQVEREPADSPARVYVLGAVFCQSARDSAAHATAHTELLQWLEKGKVNEKFAAALSLAHDGSAADRPALTALLQSPDADVRVGAAAALLRLPP